MIECFLTNLYSIDVMAPFCLELQKRGYKCHLALDELFWKISYGEHFDIKRAIEKAKKWGVELNLRLNYDAKIVVTQWRSDWMLFSKYKNLKAHISYGIGLNKNTNFTNYPLKDLQFDLFFIHGDFEEKLLLKKGIDKKRIIKIGFPKLKYQKENLKIKKEKPIITYLPTWDEYKCIDIAIDKLTPLKNKFDIYIKPHPLQSKEDLEKLSCFNVLGKDTTIKSIVNFSDYIFSDLKSGALFDCLYYGFNKIFAFSYQKDLKNFYKDYKTISIFCEDDEIDLNKKTQIDKNFFFNEEWNLENIENIDKISYSSNEKEIDILIERLKKVYKDCYEKL
jgi:hypothetical protein